MPVKFTKNGSNGGLLVGKTDKENGEGILAEVLPSKKPVILGGAEVIINENSVKSKKKHVFDGKVKTNVEILSDINQEGGGVAIPVEHVAIANEGYEKGGPVPVIDFNPNDIPSKWMVGFAKELKSNNPEIWNMAGGGSADDMFEKLCVVVKRGYWLNSEEPLYIKWKTYAVRHKKDFRTAGVVAMLKWLSKVDKGWSYMKKTIQDQIKRNKSVPAAKKAKGGTNVFNVPAPATEEELLKRQQRKETQVQELAKNIQRLRLNVTNGLKSKDEKEFLTSLVVAVIDITGERVGNDSSAENGHFGVTGLRRNHIQIQGNKVTLKYVGKSGVKHETSFTDEKLASCLRRARKNAHGYFIFTTSDGFRINAEKVNRYLTEFGVTAKDLRGYSANRWVVDKLNGLDIDSDPVKRKKQFLKIITAVANKIGHGKATLRKHYLLPVIETQFIENGHVVDIKNLVSYKDGGTIPGGNQEFNEGLSYLLNDRGKTNHIGDESGKQFDNGISSYKSKEGSYRYVKYVNKVPVAGLQIVSKDKVNGIIANVYTTADNRRKGFASELLNKANKDFKVISHSTDRNISGNAWAESDKINKKSFGGRTDSVSVPPDKRFKDNEGRERFEIDDSTAILNLQLIENLSRQAVSNNKSINRKLKELLLQWEGYDYYEDISDIDVEFFVKSDMDSLLYAYQPNPEKVLINAKKISTNGINEQTSKANSKGKGPSKQARPGSQQSDSKTVGGDAIKSRSQFRQSLRARFFHEIQHAVQKRLGITVEPSSPGSIIKSLKRKYAKPQMPDSDFMTWIEHKFGKPYKSIEYDFYIDIPSEQEGIETQKRAFMSEQEREYTPSSIEMFEPCTLMSHIEDEIAQMHAKKMASGGEVDKEESDIQKIKDSIDAMSPDQLAEIHKAYEGVRNNMLIEEEKKVQDYENEKVDLLKQVDELHKIEKTMEYGKEKEDTFKKRNAIAISIHYLELKIRNQQNKVYAIRNGGDLTSFTDKKDVLHEEIPDFHKINTEFISFDAETILNDPLPIYIPLINENEFARKGYVFDTIRIDKDIYILATNGYKEYIPIVSSGYSDYDKKVPAQDGDMGYIIVTLDQLALINDYYYTKAKATEQKKAAERNEKVEAWYDKLPEATRLKTFNQPGYYKVLPVAVKKKISEQQWELLSLSEKESYYKPFKKVQGKRLMSKLEDNQMWISFHEMYERFINPNALPIKKDGTAIAPGEKRIGMFGNKEVFAYWYAFRDMMKWKIKDIAVQRQTLSESRKIALETSFGEANTNDSLKEQYGILVKRQNGEKINPVEIDQIKRVWIKLNSIYGGLVQNAKDANLKISHTGTTLVFASKAVGVYIPQMGAIAVSNKFGDNQFESIMAHEVAHWIDNTIGQRKGKRYATDDFESSAGIIADTLRKNMNAPADSDYINSTKECFARAMEQFFAIQEFGEEATLIYSYTKFDEIRTYFTEGHYVNKEVYNTKLKPLIEDFLVEHKDFFKYGIDKTHLEPKIESEMENIIKMEIYKDVKLISPQGHELFMHIMYYPDNEKYKYVISYPDSSRVQFRYKDGATGVDAAFDKMLAIYKRKGYKLKNDKGEHEEISVNIPDESAKNSEKSVDEKSGQEIAIPENLSEPVYINNENNIETFPMETHKSKNYEITEEFRKEYERMVNQIKEGIADKGKYHMDVLIGELITFIDENPKLYPEYISFMYNELPKKHWAGQNIYDIDFPLPGIQQWLKDTNQNLLDVLPVKEYKLPKYKPFEVKPDDKTFMAIHSEFVAGDELRPAMLGTNFNKYGVVTTDAHVLLFTEYKHIDNTELGTYCYTKQCFTAYPEGKNDDTYPNWGRVIPADKASRIVLNVEALYDYLQNLLKLNILPSGTNAVAIKYLDIEGSEKLIGFNVKFLLVCLDGMAKLGYKDLEIGIIAPNRGVLIYPSGKASSVLLSKTDFCLIMPLNIDASEDSHFFKSHSYNSVYDIETNCTTFSDNPKPYCFDGIVVEKQKMEKAIDDVKKENENLKGELDKAKVEIAETKKQMKAPSGVFYAKVKPLVEEGEWQYVRVSADEYGGFIAGYNVFQPLNSTKSKAHFTKDQFMDMLENGEYVIISKSEAESEIDNLSKQAQKEASLQKLKTLKTMLETA